MSFRIPKILEEVERELAITAERTRQLTARRDFLLSKTEVVCGRCGAIHEIRELIYIQTHWYTQPYGCTDGDYWNPGEGQTDCPMCGAMGRMYEFPELEKMKHLFRKVHQCHCKQDWSVCTDPRPCRECIAEGRTRDGNVKLMAKYRGEKP